MSVHLALLLLTLLACAGVARATDFPAAPLPGAQYCPRAVTFEFANSDASELLSRCIEQGYTKTFRATDPLRSCYWKCGGNDFAIGNGGEFRCTKCSH